jgi:oxalate decarboxylase/phosphoglucose isomerase-like protein (cupin superfamily)
MSLEPRFLHDSFLAWCRAQPAPTAEGYGIDLMTVETRPWDLFGMRGAICLPKGRDDYSSVFCFELPAGGKSRPVRHVYEDVVYVLSGHGSTAVETPDGRKVTFEWGPNALFSVPLNSRYQHFNGSGAEPARLAVTHNLPLVMNLFRSEAFIFDNPVPFPERMGEADWFSGEGRLNSVSAGRHQWETNLVADICAFKLESWEARGVGSKSLRWILSDGSLGCHTSEIRHGTYKKGHAHYGGTNVYVIDGTGYTLLWYPGDKDFIRVDWSHGVVCTPPAGMLHQHFNTGNHPSRYLAIQFGSVRYPVLSMKREMWETAVDKSAEEGGAQVEYEHQDPRIHAMWLAEMDRNGVKSEMGDLFDEGAIRKTSL